MMNLRYRAFCYVVLIAIPFSASSAILSQRRLADQLRSDTRVKLNFNSDWRVIVGDTKGAEEPTFDDSKWKGVTIPYAWNEDDAFRKSIADLPTDVAWYRKHFQLPRQSLNKKVFLEFEGIRHAGEFYLNGKFIGRHENGVMGFGFDITEFINHYPAENVLAVRVDNRWDYREKATNTTYQGSDRNFYANYGGINKNAYLHITDRLYQTLPLYSNLSTTGVYVYAQDINTRARTARITVKSEVRNESTKPGQVEFTVTVVDRNGRVLKTFLGEDKTLNTGETKILRASAELTDVNFWSWGYGYLYDVYTTLRVKGHSDSDTVKTRTGFRKTEFANGEFKLNDRVLQLKGYAQRTTNEWPATGNAVPAWLSDFSNELMVDSNANLVRWMHVTPWKQDVESCDRVGLMQAMPAGDSERDVDGRRWEQRAELMRDAIIYNRNNPSVIFYESGNKGISDEHMLQMKAIRDQYDPHGGRAIGSREMLDSKTAEYGGEMLYINKSASKPLWATEYSRDEGLRKYWDEFSPPFHKDGEGPRYRDQDASAYNRNQDSHAIENIVRWYDYWRERPGTGKRVSSGGVNIIFSDSNTHFRGAENYRRSGEVDAMRIPKDGFYAHQVMWDGWVDVERPLTHIIGHWNYTEGVKKSVYVVSSGARVELLINGVSQGFGEQSSRFLFTFKNVQWHPGLIRAVAIDANGRRVSEDSKRTAGKPAAIRLAPHLGPGGLRADGADLALIDVEVVDAVGQRCPTALNMVTFSLNGPAVWRGGIAQGPDNHILSKVLPVEGGINRFMVRALPQAGPIVIQAQSEGLKGASLKLISRPVVVQNGFSPELPGENLKSSLKRGPTPRSVSLTLARIPVLISRASAGSNPAKAGASFDDNETTDWSSDGTLKNSWIKYEFEKAVPIGEVVLKLVSWRTQSYPIRILVDEKLVYNGATERSLGYVTLGFPQVTGKSVRIELAAAANNRDTFGNIIEIPGTPDPNSAAGRATGKDTLGIVEVEIYQPRR